MTEPLSAFIIGPGLVILVGVLLLYGVRANLELCLASRNWQSTMGTITESRLLTGVEARERLTEYRDEYDDERSLADEDADYVPHVTYEYRVNGKWYESDRLSFFDDGYNRRSWAERMVQKYHNGADVSVRYDPDNPSQATLQLFSRSTKSSILVVSFSLIFAGIWFMSDIPGAPFVFLFLAVGIFCWGAWTLWVGFQSKRWPTTVGTVLKQETKKLYVSSGPHNEGLLVRTESRKYKPILEYAYTVDGTEYVSETFAIGGKEYPSREAASAALNEHVDDGEVTVRYDPDTPWRATVIPGINRTPSLLALIVGLGVTLSIVFLVLPGEPPVSFRHIWIEGLELLFRLRALLA